jgi:hypothetical protein
MLLQPARAARHVNAAVRLRAMNQPEKPDLPERRPADSTLPARNLTTQELEAVIRRAVELQAGSGVEDGIPQSEVVRIGQELGLDAGAMRRAIAEVRSRAPADATMLGRSMGPRVVRCSRTLRRPAAATGLLVERYLLETEFMVVQRRFPERTRYVRDGSVAATLARVARGFTRTQQPLDLKQVDVAVAALDDTSCLVEVSVDLGGDRAGTTAGAIGLGGAAAGGIAAVVWATPVADPFMLLGLPAFAGIWYSMKAVYGAVRRSTEEKLEAFLDRLEHNELRSK